MNASRVFILHPQAAQDINEIWEFVARVNPKAATGVREEILDAIRNLVAFPYQGHARSDLTSRPLRFWRVHNYLIAYAPEKQPLRVVAVLHGRRSPRVLAAILRERE